MSEQDLLSRFGIVKASTKQVESRVLQQMQKDLEESKLQAVQLQMKSLREEINRFPRRKQLFTIKHLKDIDKSDTELLHHYKQFLKLQKVTQEYSDLSNNSNESNVQSSSTPNLSKRSREASLPGNLQKRPKIAETDEERQIRLGKITPFSQLKRNTVMRTISAPSKKALTKSSNTVKEKPKVRLSSLLKGAKNTSTSKKDIGVVVVRRKKAAVEEDTTPSPSKRKPKTSTRIAEPVPNFVEASKNVKLEGGFKLPKKLFKQLFEHQQTSVKWMWELYRSEVGGIIADEMGLGKTIQVVAFVAGLQYSGFIQLPSLVICPTTIMTQWQLEFKKWWPHIRVEILHASECDNIELLVEKVKAEQGVFVTSYGTLQSLQKIILPIEFELVVLDEGHKIRNPDAAVTLACKQLRSPNRIILTGAPIQNNLQELWSLFDFIFPGKLGTLPVFKETFEKPIRLGGYSNATPQQVQTAYKCAVVLRDEIKPFLLRRMKEDVNIGLPEKFEQVLFCPLLDNQRKLYQQFIDSKTVENVLTGKGNLLAATISLRKICNHPDVLQLPDDLADYGNWKRSGKMTLLQQLLPLWKEENHRCLIFTQTRKMLDILESFCIDMKFSYLRMDGNTPVRKRPDLIDQYQEDSSIFIFILTTKTGGIGVNLTRADRIILYDPDWNPTTDVQARERAWRIGQLNSVTIYRLITSGTIEEKIYQRQIYKEFLSNKILKDPRQKRLFHSRIIKDLFSLEQPGDDGSTETCDLFSDSRVTLEEEAEGDNFIEEEEKKEEPEENLWTAIDKDKELDNLLGEVEEVMKGKEKKNVLAELLSASGIKQVLSHDSVVGSKKEALLESQEANAIAQAAARALRKSVQQCVANEVHVPTWTGSSGSAGAPKKRFGSVKNTVIDQSSPAGINNFSSPKKVPQTWTSASMYSPQSSSSVLDNLRQMKDSSSPKGESKDKETQGGSLEILANLKNRSAVENGKSGILSKVNMGSTTEISTQLHELFLANGGTLTSTKIVNNFQHITKHSHKMFFKKLLRTMAKLNKQTETWTLRPEYKK